MSWINMPHPCVHPTDALQIPHFSWVIHLDTRAVSFRFSTHPWNIYCIFTCVWHIYSGHLTTNSFVYILQMLWKFRICPRSFTRTPGLCVSGFPHFFWDNYPDTRVVFFQIFCTLLGHVLHFYLHVTYLSGTFTHQIIYVQPADALNIPHFSQDNYLDTQVVFSGFPHIPRTCTALLWKLQIFPKHLPGHKFHIFPGH